MQVNNKDATLEIILTHFQAFRLIQELHSDTAGVSPL